MAVIPVFEVQALRRHGFLLLLVLACGCGKSPYQEAVEQYNIESRAHQKLLDELEQVTAPYTEQSSKVTQEYKLFMDSDQHTDEEKAKQYDVFMAKQDEIDDKMKAAMVDVARRLRIQKERVEFAEERLKQTPR